MKFGVSLGISNIIWIGNINKSGNAFLNKEDKTVEVLDRVIQLIQSNEKSNKTTELTDDKTLTLQERRDKQIRELPAKSIEYKAIKLADHCSNISAIPESWEPERVKAYREWSWSIAELCVDACTHLEKEYKKRYGETSRIQVRPSL